MKKKKRFFHWKKQGLSIALAVLISSIHLVSANLELVKADVYEVEQEEFFETVNQEPDYVKNPLDTYQKAMEQLKELPGIISSGSLESQLEEIVTRVQRTLVHLQDIKDEIERQLEGNYEVDTEGMSQLEAIFKRIYTLKMYGDNLKIFHDVVQGVLEMDSTTTNEEVYQSLSNLKDQVEEYGNFLDRTEQLIYPNGVNGSSSLITGEQTKEELNQVYAKIKEMMKQQELFDWKELLELNPDETIQGIYDRISSMKDTMAEYWAYLSQVEEVIQMEDGNHLAEGSSIVTGSSVTTRLTAIYERLIVMVSQQDTMADRISQLLEREQNLLKENQELAKVNQELEGLNEELMQQREQTNQFLSELKELLGLDHNAESMDVIHAVTNMKETLSEYWNYLGEVEELIQMPDGSSVDKSDIVTGSAVTVRLTGIYDKLADMVKQQDRIAETIEDLLDREDILTDTVRELKELLEEMEEQKQQAEHFLKELKSLLGLEDDAGYRDVIDMVSNMRNQLDRYVELIEDFIKQLGMTSDEGEQEELSAQLRDVLNQVWGMMNQLTEEIRKSGEAEKKATLLEQKNEELITENQQVALENQQLKKENEELKKNLSSHTSDDSNTEELERKNQQQQERMVELERKSQKQQERIAELEKNLLSQAEEVESLIAEREQLLEMLSSKDRQIEELKGQIGFLTAQLAEKERKIVELEQRLEEQRPIWELLEKNEIDEEQLIRILNRKEENQNAPVTEKETIVIQENSSSEKSMVQETRESTETTDAKADILETVVSETEEPSSFDKEEVTTATAAETVETTIQEEESQEKTEFRRLISIFFLLLILVLSGTMVLIFKSKKNTRK